MAWVAPLLLPLALGFLVAVPDSGVSTSHRLLGVLNYEIREGVPYVLLALGAGIVLSTGGVDISGAGVATVTGILFAALTQWKVPPVLAALLALCVSALSGYGVGRVVHRDAPSLLMSWAAGALWSIASVVIADASHLKGGITGLTVEFDTASLWNHGTGITIEIFAATLIPTFLAFTNLPRHWRAVGANRDGAVYAGIRTFPALVSAYTVSALLAGLAGIMWALIGGAASTTDHQGKELSAVSIAVLGGTAMSGGYLFTRSIMAAAFFWVAARWAVDALDWRYLVNYQMYAPNAVFAALFLVLRVRE